MLHNNNDRKMRSFKKNIKQENGLHKAGEKEKKEASLSPLQAKEVLFRRRYLII